MPAVRVRTATGWQDVALSGPQGPSSGGTMDPWHIVGTTGEPAYQNSWVAYDAFRPARFRKFPDGKVKLAGVVKSGVSGTIVFTLPVGYRPTATRGFTVSAGTAPVEIGIGGDGTVVVTAYSGAVGAPGSYCFLDGIEFDTESVSAYLVGPQGDAGVPAPRYYAQLRRGAAVSVPNNTATLITFDTIWYNTPGSMFAIGAPTRVLSVVDGLWSYGVFANWAAGFSFPAFYTLTVYDVATSTAGAVYTGSVWSQSNPDQAYTFPVVPVAAGYYVTLQVKQSSGAAVSLSGITFVAARVSI